MPEWRLLHGDNAHILRMNNSDYDADRGSTSSDLAATFARHGIKTTRVHPMLDQTNVTEALNKTVVEKGADMIAIGAFDQSRAYDLVIGGATRDVLKNARFPVLFSR